MIPSATLPPIGGIIPNRRNHAQTIGIMPKRSESFYLFFWRKWGYSSHNLSTSEELRFSPLELWLIDNYEWHFLGRESSVLRAASIESAM